MIETKEPVSAPPVGTGLSCKEFFAIPLDSLAPCARLPAFGLNFNGMD
jgi:hypothetical protein